MQFLFPSTAGLNVPVVEWKGTLDKMNSKVKKLEEDFEADCVQKKVNILTEGSALTSSLPSSRHFSLLLFETQITRLSITEGEKNL